MKGKTKKKKTKKRMKWKKNVGQKNSTGVKRPSTDENSPYKTPLVGNN